MEENRSFSETQSAEFLYPWGQRFLSFEQLCMAALVVGAPGSGKTLTIKQLLKHVLPRIEAGEPLSAVIYDSKTDLLRWLLPLIPDGEKVKILNPLDKRCAAWDMAKDINDRLTIDTFADYLIPAPESLAQNRYFSQTAQAILAQVILALHLLCEKRWRLKDLVIIARSEDLMRFILGKCEATKHTIDEHFAEGVNSLDAVRSTLAVSIGEYEAIALAWEEAFRAEKPRTFEVSDWISQPQLIVLGNSHRARVPVRRLNTLLLSQLQNAVMDQQFDVLDENDNPPPKRETWFFLDEFRELGKIEDFNEFLITCRAKHAPVILGFQDIGGLDELYGQHNAREILACTNTAALFHINNTNPATQEWAKQVYGMHEFIDTTQAGYSYDEEKGSGGMSASEARVREDKWMPSQFSEDLPTLLTSGQLNGLYSIGGEWEESALSAETLFRRDGNPWSIPGDPLTKDSPSNFDPADLAKMPKYLAWDENDYVRLNIAGLEERANGIPINPAKEAMKEALAKARDRKHRSKGPTQDYEDG